MQGWEMMVNMKVTVLFLGFDEIKTNIFYYLDVEKLSKMKKLLDILSNPSKRMPLETLRKCEVVLEKLDLKRVSDILKKCS